MTDNPQRVALGSFLRDLRQRAGKQLTEVEDLMDWYDGKASRVEVSGRGIVPAEAEKLAEFYGATASDREWLRELAIAARKRTRPAHVADFAQSYINFERQAVEISVFDDMLVHGLVQTAAYARALLSTSPRGQLEERVRDRMGRQAILMRADPPEVRILLGEAAIHQQVGGPAVMREQVGHLREVAARLPHVSIRVIPFAAGAHRALGVGFRIVRVADPAELTRVYLEGLTEATYIHNENEVDTYLSVFEHLWENVAANDRESGSILRRKMT
ncbi:helix-turn-helix domain-containing protein [Kibdelosporangium aridum]|uniref:helix-turn-helix domain-containing protein n=1 Tax=Kibdelosporangium aridum TaxID=2030 RepID=UPI0035E53E1F